MDLTKQDFMKNFTPTVLDAIKYKGKQYTVPTGLSYYSGVYYNKTIFEKSGLKIPTTWSEFMTVCQTLKSKGVVPLGISGKDSAGVNMLGVVQDLYPNKQDKVDLAKGLWDKSIKLTDGKQLEVLTKVKSLYDLAEPNFAGVSYNTMTAGFVKGQFAMMSDGTWNQTTIDSAGGSSFKYGYCPAAFQRQCRRQRLPWREGGTDACRAEQLQEHRYCDGLPLLLLAARELQALPQGSGIRPVPAEHRDHAVLYLDCRLHQDLPAGMGHDLGRERQGGCQGPVPVQLLRHCPLGRLDSRAGRGSVSKGLGIRLLNLTTQARPGPKLGRACVR